MLRRQRLRGFPLLVWKTRVNCPALGLGKMSMSVKESESSIPTTTLRFWQLMLLPQELDTVRQTT